MVSSNRYTLRCSSQILLVYLLGLHLVGVPLHRHADSASGKDGVAVVVANDACLLCNWLVQPSLVVADQCFVEDVLWLPALLNTVATPQWIAAWVGFVGGSRAPPAG